MTKGTEMKKVALFVVCLSLVVSAFAGEYKLSSVSVIDGDTVKANIHLGFDIVLANVLVRLAGVDTPENKRCSELEKKAGDLVKDWLIQKIKNGHSFKLITQKKERGKFGRPMGILLVDNIDICKELVRLKFAKAYFGKKKEIWKTEQLEYIINTLTKEQEK